MEIRDILDRIRSESNKVVLSFSGGKDSLACWCLLKDYGFEIVPFYMAMIPGMSFVEKYLEYCESHFGQRIIRTIHPNLYRWLFSNSSQPPYMREAIKLLDLPGFGYTDVEKGVKRTAGLPHDAWVAIGIRETDSPIRKKTLGENGGINPKRRAFYPIWKYKKDDIEKALIEHKIKLPVDYTMFGRSFDGVDYRYLKAVRERYPEDYQRILTWLPMQDMEFARQEFAVKHGQAKI